jgi:hypothetical protein
MYYIFVTSSDLDLFTILAFTALIVVICCIFSRDWAEHLSQVLGHLPGIRSASVSPPESARPTRDPAVAPGYELRPFQSHSSEPPWANVSGAYPLRDRPEVAETIFVLLAASPCGGHLDDHSGPRVRWAACISSVIAAAGHHQEITR